MMRVGILMMVIVIFKEVGRVVNYGGINWVICFSSCWIWGMIVDMVGWVEGGKMGVERWNK